MRCVYCNIIFSQQIILEFNVFLNTFINQTVRIYKKFDMRNPEMFFYSLYLFHKIKAKHQALLAINENSICAPGLSKIVFYPSIAHVTKSSRYHNA